MINRFSCASLRIDLFCKNEFISHGTGFLASNQEKVFLISNWHVFSGLNASDLSTMDKENSAIPTRALLHYRLPDNLSECLELEVLLQDSEHNPFWKEHPLGRKVDLAAVHIPALDHDIQIYPSSATPAKPLSKRVTQQCFVVGFPFGKTNSNDFPVWKAATIASEPSVGYSAQHNFLVDSTVTPGMSGSPVYLRASGNIEFEDGSSQMFAGAINEVFEFIGVYSGRIQSRKEGGALDIGLVWSRKCVEDLLNDPQESKDFLAFYGIHK